MPDSKRKRTSIISLQMPVEMAHAMEETHHGDHCLTPQQLEVLYCTSIKDGLSEGKAAELLQHHGPNALKDLQSTSYWKIFQCVLWAGAILNFVAYGIAPLVESGGSGHSQNEYLYLGIVITATIIGTAAFGFYVEAQNVATMSTKGSRFSIRTDHAALKWLLEFKNPEGQVARWIEQLQEYDFIIEHRSGKSHGNADALSRRPCPDDCKHCLRQEDKDCVKMLRTDTVSEEWSNEVMQRAQQEDPDIKPIIDWMKADSPKPRWCEIAPMSRITKSYWAQWESLMMHNGVLCRKWESANGKDAYLQIVVPRKRVREVLTSFYDGVSGGHLGVKRTLMKIRQRFYWIHCREDVEDWCKKCTSCASVKGPQTRSRGALKLYNVGAPWERIALDVAGPFPTSDSGNKYILVIMDYFTKWPEAFAISNQEAVTVAVKAVEWHGTGVVVRWMRVAQGRSLSSSLGPPKAANQEP